jgi:hypothetical protein
MGVFEIMRLEHVPCYGNFDRDNYDRPVDLFVFLIVQTNPYVLCEFVGK